MSRRAAAASMRPPAKRRKNPPAPNHLPHVHLRFNEAACKEAEKLVFQVGEAGVRKLLQ